MQLPGGLIIERDDNKQPAVAQKPADEKKPATPKRGRPPKAKPADEPIVEGCPLPSADSKS
ncbi:MAG: hypothetical protein CMP83_01540 [Gammaproteobacteria bacterium]|nr:hypothetical protein [Gammaproteobacteria bacterium]